MSKEKKKMDDDKAIIIYEELNNFFSKNCTVEESFQLLAGYMMSFAHTHDMAPKKFGNFMNAMAKSYKETFAEIEDEQRQG